MHTHIVLAAGAVALLVSPARSLSQAVEPPVDTVLARLTTQALAANPTLQANQASARAATNRIRAAGALPDPMLSAGVMNLALPRFAFRESDFTEVDLELSQEFPWPGTLGARTQAARAEARRAGDGGHCDERKAKWDAGAHGGKWVISGPSCAHVRLGRLALSR